MDEQAWKLLSSGMLWSVIWETANQHFRRTAASTFRVGTLKVMAVFFTVMTVRTSTKILGVTYCQITKTKCSKSLNPKPKITKNNIYRQRLIYMSWGTMLQNETTNIIFYLQIHQAHISWAQYCRTTWAVTWGSWPQSSEKYADSLPAGHPVGEYAGQAAFHFPHKHQILKQPSLEAQPDSHTNVSIHNDTHKL